MHETNEDCSLKIMKNFDVNIVTLNKCVKHSFVGNKINYSKDNYMLADDRELAERQGIKLHPSLAINNQTYRGSFNGEDIFQAICTSFDKIPEVCKNETI